MVVKLLSVAPIIALLSMCVDFFTRGRVLCSSHDALLSAFPLFCRVVFL